MDARGGKYPTRSVINTAGTAFTSRHWYLEVGEVDDANLVPVWCPADIDAKKQGQSTPGGNISYAYNQFLSGWDHGPGLQYDNLVPNLEDPHMQYAASPESLGSPTSTLIIADGAINNSFTSWYVFNRPWSDPFNGRAASRHANGGNNTLWADGHASSLSEPGAGWYGANINAGGYGNPWNQPYVFDRR